MIKVKIYIRKLVFSSGKKEYQVLKEYEDKAITHSIDCGRYKANLFGKILAKRKAKKLMKFYEKYSFTADDYIIEEVVE